MRKLKLWRHAGTILAASGVLHIAVFAVMGRESAGDIVRAGLLDALGSHHDRNLVWYGGWVAGAALVLVGLLMTSWVRAVGRPVPAYVGWTLVVLGAATAVLQPASGGILLILAGAAALVRPKSKSQAQR